MDHYKRTTSVDYDSFSDEELYRLLVSRLPDMAVLVKGVHSFNRKTTIAFLQLVVMESSRVEVEPLTEQKT